MRLGKGNFFVFGCGIVISACGQQGSENLRPSLSFAATESRVQDLEPQQNGGITIQSINTDFQTVRRMERQLRVDSPLAVSPTEDLVDRAQKAAHDLNPETQLQLLHLRRGDRFSYATFQQVVGERPIVGARFVLRLNAAGDWVTTNSRLVSAALLKSIPAASHQTIDIAALYGRPVNVLEEKSVILPRLNGELLSLHAAREFLVFDSFIKGPLTLWIDESTEEILTVLNQIRSLEGVEIAAPISPNSPSDSLVAMPLGFATVFSGTSKLGITNESGQISIVDPFYTNLSVSLENPSFKVIRQGLRFQPTPIAAEAKINLADKISSEEVNTFHWLNQINNFHAKHFNFKLPYQLKAFTHYNGVRPSCLNEVPSESSRCTPDAEDADNAFFMGGLNILALGTGGAYLKNTALSRDVVVHEFGHAVTDSIYGEIDNYEFNAMNEAFSDYLAATFSNDPLIAEGAMQDEVANPYLRRVDSTMNFKTDFEGRSFHQDGQIFSAALWEIRKIMGTELADKTIHEARLAQAATVREFFLELLAIDEDRDDKNPFTASKYSRAIMAAFYKRGLTSGTLFSK